MRDQELQQFRSLSKEVQESAEKIGALVLKLRRENTRYFDLMDVTLEALGEDYKSLCGRDGTFNRSRQREIMKLLRIWGCKYSGKKKQVSLRNVLIEELKDRIETLVRDYNGSH